MKNKSLRFKIITAAVSAVALVLVTVGVIFAITSVTDPSSNDYVDSDNDVVTNSDDIIATSSDDNSTEFGEPKIVFTTEEQIGETMGFQMNITCAYIDWGDGEIVKINGSKTPIEYEGQYDDTFYYEMSYSG